MYKESVIWRIDDIDLCDEYENAVAFCHRLGYRCDSIGWAKLNIKSETDLKKLVEIREAADQIGGYIRAGYEKEIVDDESEWCILEPEYFYETDFEFCDGKYIPEGIKGYSIPLKYNLIELGDDGIIAVTENFRRVCMENCLSGVDFYWMKDVGKYKSNPFYMVQATSEIPYFMKETEHILKEPRCFAGVRNGKEYYTAKSFDTAKQKKACVQADYIGGNLSKISQLVDELQSVSIPVMINPDIMPDTDFCFYSGNGSNGIIIKRSVADILINEKVLKKSEIKPVIVGNVKEQQLLRINSRHKSIVDINTLIEWQNNREKWEKKEKPEYSISEKDALRLLRADKKLNSEMYNRGLSMQKAGNYGSTRLSCILALYRFSNGLSLSDEINLFPIEEAETNTKTFLEEIASEEIVQEQFPEIKDSWLIGKMANGDAILLWTDNSIVIYEHEADHDLEKWESIWAFILENV